MMKHTLIFLMLSTSLLFSCKTSKDASSITNDNNYFEWVNHLDREWLVLKGDKRYLTIDTLDMNEVGVYRKATKRAWQHLGIEKLIGLSKVELKICLDADGDVFASTILSSRNLNENLKFDFNKVMYLYEFEESLLHKQCSKYTFDFDINTQGLRLQL